MEKQENLINIVQEVNKQLDEYGETAISVDTYSGYIGYKPQFVFDALNKHVGIGNWGFEELSNEIKVVGQGDKGDQLLAVAQVKVWVFNKEYAMPAYGQSRVTKGEHGDAMKGAQTDAIKKALSYFSIGSKAYRGLLKK